MTNKIFTYEKSIVFRTIGKEYLIIKDSYSPADMKRQLINLATEYEKYIKETIQK